jgi:chloride channel protein, CIC family
VWSNVLIFKQHEMDVKYSMQNDQSNSDPQKLTATRAEVESEIQEDLMIREHRRRLFPRAALVGLVAGLVASFFRIVLAGADQMRNGLIEWSHQFPFLGWIFPVLFGMAGATLSVLLVRRYAPETSGSGIPHLEAVLHRLRTMDWRRILPVKFLAGALAIGGGLTLGREGPTVQMGGAVGDAISRWLRVPPRERRSLIAAGAGAGLAAAFNAPLAGVIFVLEEVQRDFHPFVFGAAFLAAAIADIVARLLSGAFPVFSIPAYPAPPTGSLIYFGFLGIFAGLLGVVFNRSLLANMNLFARLQVRWGFLLPAAIGAIIGFISWFYPMAIGGGHTLTETALAGTFSLLIIPLLFTLRFFLTTSSYATGAAGGIFAPLLALGALLGLAVGRIANSISPDVVPIPAVFAVVGMAAYFTAIVRAPLTGIVLIVEMTGNYQQMLPLLVACFCAYAVAELLKDLPVYEALLERDLLRDGTHYKLQEPMVIDLFVEVGAPFAGQELRMLGLPPGCVLVRCTENGRSFVPTAATALEPHMKITAVIAPEAENALTILRNGCKTRKLSKTNIHNS